MKLSLYAANGMAVTTIAAIVQLVDSVPYIIILTLCITFNVLAFLWVGMELRSQRARADMVEDKFMAMWSGVVNVLMDHGARIAAMEGQPFRPATVLDRLKDKGVKVSFEKPL